MRVSALLVIIAFVYSPAFASSVRSSGFCSGSGIDPVEQQCGNERFFCPVNSQCIFRSLRCMPGTTCLSQSGVQQDCDASGSGYSIRLGRVSLFKRRLEFNHQFITYRGFTYEYGCGYGVQILDVNDQNYKYKDYSDAAYEVKGTSQCIYI